MKFFKVSLVLSALVLIACNSTANTQSACPSQIQINNAEVSEIHADSTHILRKLSPDFFGFNVEWNGFQAGLWDEKSAKVRPDVANWLRPFAGAVYRYPGGTIANTMNWQDMVGNPEKRPLRKFESWSVPFKAQFGLDEYLSFVKDVNGQAWYVANIYGDLAGEKTPQMLASQAGQLSTYFAEKRKEGFSSIFRWELGNEMDRGQQLWRPEKVVMVSKLVAAEIKRADSQAKFVTFLQEFPSLESAGISASQYNETIVKGMQQQTNEYAMHFYYDAKEQTVPKQLHALCSALNDAKTIKYKQPPAIWITEHASVPSHFWDDNPDQQKAHWPHTANLAAAIGVADMIIASAQIPEVKGTFVHALAGVDGPWPLFHRLKNGEIRPSSIYWALSILRESMLENVLLTESNSTNNSGSNDAFKGGYDVRSVVMNDAKSKQYTIWTINYSSQSVATHLNIPTFRNLTLTGQHTWLSSSSSLANNYEEDHQILPAKQSIILKFDSASIAEVKLPPYSISSITFLSSTANSRPNENAGRNNSNGV